MKVLNLQCGEQHLFEGWFAELVNCSSSQGLLTCRFVTTLHFKNADGARLRFVWRVTRPTGS
jgi:hypothetical protein